MWNRDDNKTVALGTSKINYMDPRISVAWCKRQECDISKIFAKALETNFLGQCLRHDIQILNSHKDAYGPSRRQLGQLQSIKSNILTYHAPDTCINHYFYKLKHITIHYYSVQLLHPVRHLQNTNCIL